MSGTIQVLTGPEQDTIVPFAPPPTKPKLTWRDLDNRDDRKEIYVALLPRLHPVQRVRWLEWCCRHSVLPNAPLQPRVGQSTYDLLAAALKEDTDFRLTIDIFQTFWVLTIQYSLNPQKALAKLVEMVRRKKR